MNKNNNSKIKLASYFAITVSAILCVLKFYAYKKTGSCTIHASAMDSLMDIVISFINLVAIYMLTIKKGNLAPYGWDKLASVIALAQCSIITLLSFEIMHESFEKLYNNNNDLHNFEYVIAIAVIGFILSLLLVRFQKKVIKETNSLIIKADMIHFMSDLYSNFLIFIGFVCIKYFNIIWLDGILGIVVSFYLLFAIIGLLKTSIFSLLDLNFVNEQKIILEALKKYELSSEDLTVTFSGAKFIINVSITEKLIEKINEIEKTIKKSIANNQILSAYTCSHCTSHPEEMSKHNHTFQITFVLIQKI